MAETKMVWILFGNMSGHENLRSDLVRAYQDQKGELEKKGYYLAIPPTLATSKHGFLNYIADDTTYAVVWNSHGSWGSKGVPDGALVTSKNEAIVPDHVRTVSKNLRAVALWGCVMGRIKGWPKRLGLDTASPYAFLTSEKFLFGDLLYSNPMYTFAAKKGEASFNGWIEKLL